jgi:hypothetical protein
MSDLPCHTMTAGQLSKESGICRQWLNELSDRGEIPGCTRGANQKLVIKDGPELRVWIEKKSRKAKDRRKRVTALQQRFSGKFSQDDLDQAYRACDLAKLTGLDARTINRRAAEIPGRILSRTGFQIRWVRCSQLKEWIEKHRNRLAYVDDIKLLRQRLKATVSGLKGLHARYPDWPHTYGDDIEDVLDEFLYEVEPYRRLARGEDEEDIF